MNSKMVLLRPDISEDWPAKMLLMDQRCRRAAPLSLATLCRGNNSRGTVP